MGYRILALAVALLALLGTGAARPGHAAPAPHPAPSVVHDYLVRLGVSSAQVFLRLSVSPQLVPQVYRLIDTNGDGVTEPAERQAWLDQYLAHMRFTVDDQPLPITFVGASAVDQRNLVVSMQHPVTVTMQLSFTLPADPPGGPPTDHHFVLADGNNYVKYDEYYGTWEDAAGAITLAHDLTQPANPATFEAIFERDTATPTPGATAATAPPPPAGGADPTPQESPGSVFLGQLDTFLRDPQANAGFGALLFLLAVGLGALHALTPGHGKAVVAAYLVGSRGRMRDAVALGWIVTLTHTLSVVALGLALLVLTNFVLPRWLQPALELGSGLLIVVLGLYLLAVRLRAYLRGDNPAHDHAHNHDHGHEHPHDHDHGDGHTHDHDHDHAHDHGNGRPHEHIHAGGHEPGHSHAPERVPVYAQAHTTASGPPVAVLEAGGAPVAGPGRAPQPAAPAPHTHSHVPPAGASARDLLALGISGGLVPCPDALAILLLTLPVGQLGFGLLLVSSFSLGLAAVLIAIGILMVKARGWLERFLPGRGDATPWVRALPVASAVIVVVLGVALMIGALLGQKWV